MNDFLRDANIPVLTEIIDTPEKESAADAAPAIDVAPAGMPESPPTSRIKHVSAAAADGPDRDRLENEIRERVLRQVMASIDTILEARIRDTLADVLQVAVGSLANDIRSGLQQNLEREIAHAVSEEIARMQQTDI